MNIYPPPDNPNLGELTLWCRDLWAATTTISGEVNIAGDTTYGADKFFLITEKGHFNIASGATLTIYSPDHIFASPRQQIFTGSGTVAFTTGGKVYPDWWATNTTPGTTDMTAAVTAAIASAPIVDLDIGAVDYKLTSMITITKPVRIIGHGCEPYSDIQYYPHTRGPGSWFYLAHTGKGFYITPVAAYPNPLCSLTGVEFKDFGTYRDQPTVSDPPWTPTDHDFDITVKGDASLSIKDLVLLNPTKGIQLIGDDAEARGCGTVTIDGLRSQPLLYGLWMDGCTNGQVIRNVQFGLFWTWNVGVRTYMGQNLYGITSGRNDNPTWDNIAIFEPYVGISLVDGSWGPAGAEKTSALQASNISVDGCAYGITVSGDNETSADFVNLHINGEETFRASESGILINANNVTISFTNLLVEYFQHNGVITSQPGAGANYIGLVNVTIHDWNGANDASVALAINVNDIATIGGKVLFLGGGGASPISGGVVSDHPRLTTTQRDAIASPIGGLVIYNTTTNKLNFYNGSAWEVVTSAV